MPLDTSFNACARVRARAGGVPDRAAGLRAGPNARAHREGRGKGVRVLTGTAWRRSRSGRRRCTSASLRGLSRTPYDPYHGVETRR
jgi:hypothetical protein